MNLVAGPFASRLVGLEDHEIVVRTMKRTRLDDFGDDRFSEPLDILCRSLDADADLTAIGRLRARRLLVHLLSTRARTADLLRRFPELAVAPVGSPIVITGLPGSGVSQLAELLVRNGRASPVVRAGSGALGTRRRTGRDDACDDGELFASDLRTIRFERIWHVPAYAEWYDTADLTHTYQHLRTILQILQSRRGARPSADTPRWLFASVQHLEHPVSILEAFPDATIVQVHRDPMATMASVTTAIAHERAASARGVDPDAVARYWTWRFARMLTRSIERRPAADDRFVDLTADELRTDPGACIQRIDAARVGDDRSNALDHLAPADAPDGFEPAPDVAADLAAYCDHFSVRRER